MSVHAMVWLHTSGRLYLLKPVHRAVIMQMAWRADETNDNWLTRYGIDRIAEESGTSPRTVMRAIEAASDPEIGILHAEKSHRKQTRYRFRTGAYESPKTPPLGDRGAPKTPPLGDRGAPDLVHMSHPIKNKNTSVNSLEQLRGEGDDLTVDNSDSHGGRNIDGLADARSHLRGACD